MDGRQDINNIYLQSKYLFSDLLNMGGGTLL